MPRPFLKLGYVKANGATVNRADYPTLAAFATANGLWTDSPSTEPWKFGKGNGSTTMVLPDYRNRVIQGGDSAGVLEAGLPNIVGGGVFAFDTTAGSYASGAIKNTPAASDSKIAYSSTGTYKGYSVSFSANLSDSVYGSSDTVQPSAITQISQIKY